MVIWQPKPEIFYLKSVDTTVKIVIPTGVYYPGKLEKVRSGDCINDR